MADTDSHWQSWVQGLSEGDEQVVGEFWREYGKRLQALASGYLNSRLQRREGPEDVVQSVCRTFLPAQSCRRVQFGRSGCTLGALVRYHLGQGASEGPISRPGEAAIRSRALPGQQSGRRQTGHGHGTDAGRGRRVRRPNAPDLFGMEEEERQVVTMKLEQYTYAEMAERLGCSERTIRRIVKRVQERLKRMLEESGQQ